MGVRGLTTYVNSNQDIFLRHYLLHNSNLVVDGNSMCAQLYISLNCFSAFGGDYDKYASYVRNFLKAFRKSNVKLFVIFDGSHEARKLKTAHSRLRSKIYGASRLDPVTQSSLHIFPLLLRDVFKQVLMEMNIQFTVCEFEADDEIALVARHLQCPVLSYDSDFFIYNVLYIPFNTLECKAKPFSINGERVYALECKIYKVKCLTENFGGLKEEMLPLLATLLGNDYVEKTVFNKFFSQLKLPKSNRCKNDQQRCIQAVFKWLQNESLDSAISKIIGRVRKTQKRKILTVIKQSIEGYNRKYCRSLKFLNICSEDVELNMEYQLPVDLESEEIGCVEKDDTSSESSDDNISSIELSVTETDHLVCGLPDWYADAVRKNLIPQSHLNLYTHHLYLCNPQAEDYSDHDSFICALPILKYIFDIITDFTHEELTYICRGKDHNYHRMILGQDYSILRPIDKPYNELTIEQFHTCFYQFLTVKLPAFDVNSIKVLPSNFQLCMISMLWWILYCKVPLAHVHSLLLCYVMLEVIDEKTGTFRGHRQFTNNYSKTIEELKKSNRTFDVQEELFINKNKVQYEDCLLAANVLLKHFEIDESILKRPKSYNVKRMHSFAQFQCCLQQLNSLNTICHQPFESTKFAKCFNGTFVYNIALKLENQLNPCEFIEKYLDGATTIIMFYKSLCTVYGKFAEQMGLNTMNTPHKKQRRKKTKTSDLEVDDIMNSFLMKGFESQVTI